MEEIDIVIVGGGIAGLATSLALHRKGVKSVVLERAQSVRSEGAALGIHPNGWRALEEFGVAHKFRHTSLLLHHYRSVSIENGKSREWVGPAAYGGVRCIKRNELVRALADDLPKGTIRFGYQIMSVKLHEKSSFPILQFSNKPTIKAKVVIGCDGSNSVIANFLKLNPTKCFGSQVVRGFTIYPNGHGFPPEVVTMNMNHVQCGRLAVTDTLAFWFTYFPHCSQDISKDKDAVAKLTIKSVNEFPEEWKDMIKNCDISSLYMSNVRYRPPWEIMFGKFRRGTVTVAGDAMHLMGPFLGQGGCAALEDAIVLGRCLAHELAKNRGLDDAHSITRIEEAIDAYVSERRKRLVALSAQVYLIGLLMGASSRLVKMLCLILLTILFYDKIHHTRYDCGHL